jgi:hypothetical protein
MNLLDALPLDVLAAHILPGISPRDLGRFRQTCHAARRLGADAHVWRAVEHAEGVRALPHLFADYVRLAMLATQVGALLDGLPATMKVVAPSGAQLSYPVTLAYIATPSPIAPLIACTGRHPDALRLYTQTGGSRIIAIAPHGMDPVFHFEILTVRIRSPMVLRLRVGADGNALEAWAARLMWLQIAGGHGARPTCGAPLGCSLLE